MSGALKGYRYVTALDYTVTSRHHSIGPAEVFRARNAHQDLKIYSLPQSYPLELGDLVPQSAVEVTKPKRKEGTYRR